MKKMLLSAVIAATVLVSCKKEEEKETQKTNAELIVGTWSHTNYKTDKLVGGTVVDTENDVTLAGIQMTFTADGKIKAFGETSDYTIDGKMLIIDYGDNDIDTAEIVVLTETNFDYSYEPYTFDDTTYVETLQFKK